MGRTIGPWPIIDTEEWVALVPMAQGSDPPTTEDVPSAPDVDADEEPTEESEWTNGVRQAGYVYQQVREEFAANLQVILRAAECALAMDNYAAVSGLLFAARKRLEEFADH